MKCKICSRPDVAEINRLLLSKAALRSGIISTLAARIDCHRSVIWRHRKRHLGMIVLRRAPKDQGGNLEERLERLQGEASRLQQLAENGMEKGQFERALKSLNTRIRLVELQGRLEGRLVGGKSGPPVDAKNLSAALKAARVEVEAEQDPEELARAEREYLEVCGTETK
jgi:TolA-binding protein